MRKNKEKEQIYKSIREFEKKFFPNSLKKRLEKSTDLRTLAVSLAQESLDKVKHQLMK